MINTYMEGENQTIHVPEKRASKEVIESPFSTMKICKESINLTDCTKAGWQEWCTDSRTD